MSQVMATYPPGPDQAAPAAAPDYSVDWHPSADALPAELWARCFPAPLEGLWWYRAFEDAKLEDQFTFAYAAISRGGEIVGIAPAFQMDLALEIVLPDAIAPFVAWLGRTVPALRYQRTWFVGSPCAEEGTIGLIPGVSLDEVLPALNAAVEARAKAVKAHMIVWKDVPEAAAMVLERQVNMERGRLAKLFKVPSFPGTEIHGLAVDFERYLKALTGPRRYRLKKKLKASREAIDIETEVIQHPDAAAMGEIWRLFWQTYEKATTRFEKLNPAFFEGVAAAETTYFVMLRRRSDKQLVAFMLCYFEAGRATNKFIGIDYALGDKTFLYFRLFEEFVRWAQSKGATILRSGQTGYHAKFDLGHELVPLYNFARNRNGLMNLIYAAVGRSISWSSLDPDLKAHVEARARKGDT